MITKLPAAFCAFLVLVAPIFVSARPVSFPDGYMLMLTNDGMENSANLIYSPTAQDAYGVRTDYFREDETWLHTVTYNRLLKRWNAAASQGNVFLLTGVGVGDDHGDMAPAGFIGVSADWETRRHYISYENRYIASSANDMDFEHKARVGIAPYIGGYDDIHTWLMFQVQHVPGAKDEFVATPLVRLFNTDVLGEIGYSSNKTMLFNVTVQF